MTPRAEFIFRFLTAIVIIDIAPGCGVTVDHASVTIEAEAPRSIPLVDVADLLGFRVFFRLSDVGRDPLLAVDVLGDDVLFGIARRRIFLRRLCRGFGCFRRFLRRRIGRLRRRFSVLRGRSERRRRGQGH